MPGEVDKRDGGARAHRETGAPVAVGRSEKMSKSKKNVGRPGGDHRRPTAPTRRAGSCCPTARPSATWNGPRPASRAPGASSSGCGGWSTEAAAPQPARRSRAVADGDPEAGDGLRQAVHQTIAGVADDIEAFHFNKAVARIYELANRIGDFDRDGEATRRRAGPGARRSRSWCGWSRR